LINNTQSFTRAALKGGAASLVLAFGLMSVPSFAQATGAKVAAADAADASDVEQIVVTGTLFKNPNTILSSPVTVLDQQEIKFKQSDNAEALLRDIPGVVPSIGAQVNNGNGGASFVNLRGLGYNRNLVLIDGGRVVPANNIGAVDLNNIPVALIQRVDVLTGGATTTYGADAVAGVVNFITKKDFAGVELNVTNGINQTGDGNSYRADLTIGANFDDGRGNAVFSIGYQKTDAVYQGDRPYGIDNIDSGSGGAGGSGTTVPSRVNFGTGNTQIVPATGVLQPGTYALFNFNPYNIYQTPLERWNMYGAAHYEITDNVEVYMSGMFAKNDVKTIIAPGGIFQSGLEMNYSNPYLPAAAAAQIGAANGLTVAEIAAARATTDPTNPNYKTFTANFGRRFVEAGTRDADYQTIFWQYKAGVRGKLTEGLNWDVSGTYGQNNNSQVQTGYMLNSKFQQAALASDTSTCIGANDASCVPINLFGPAGSITPAMINYLTASAQSQQFATLADVNATISGDIGLAVPGAKPVQFAVGAEYRKYTAGATADQLSSQPGELLGGGAAVIPTYGTYNAKEVFAEINAPLIEGKTGFESLSLELGGRYSDYSTAGTDFTWKVGGAWEPVQGLRFRGNYNVAARAPNIFELFSPNLTGLDNLTVDPCSNNPANTAIGGGPHPSAAMIAVCQAQGAPSKVINTGLNAISDPSGAQALATSGGNPNLGVENAKTWTIGMVVQPPQVRSLLLTVDYYHIKITSAISTPTSGDVINACFGQSTLSVTPACLQINRDPISGQLDGSPATSTGLNEPYSNLGELYTDGIDFAANWSSVAGPGKLSLGLTANYTFHSQFQATPTATDINGDVGPRECVGLYSTNCLSIQPKFSFNQRTTYAWDMFSASLLWRYLSPESVEGGDDAGYLPEFSHIRAYHYFDLTLTATPASAVTITFLVQNLFNVAPPIVGSTIGNTSYNSGNTYPSTYDALGRRFTVGANFKF
jgi:iron complex outermembrane recepter protein